MQPAQLIMTALFDRHRFCSLASARAKRYSLVFIPSGDVHELVDSAYSGCHLSSCKSTVDYNPRRSEVSHVVRILLVFCEYPSIFPWLFEQDVDLRFAVGMFLARSCWHSVLG